MLDLSVVLSDGANQLDLTTRAYAFGVVRAGPGDDRITAVEGDDAVAADCETVTVELPPP